MGCGETKGVKATRPQRQPVRRVAREKRLAQFSMGSDWRSRFLNWSQRMRRSKTMRNRRMSQEREMGQGKIGQRTEAVARAAAPLIMGTDGEPKSRQMSSLRTARSRVFGVGCTFSPISMEKIHCLCAVRRSHVRSRHWRL